MAHIIVLVNGDASASATRDHVADLRENTRKKVVGNKILYSPVFVHVIKNTGHNIIILLIRPKRLLFFFSLIFFIIIFSYIELV